jgi:ribulose-phosphate 3-epimerase
MIFASLLNADFGRLAEQVAELEESGLISGLHIDVMDGHFVPNLALGPQAVSALRSRTKLPMEVHLMVERPSTLTPLFADAGAQRVIVHAEACTHLHREISLARRLGVEVGVALNPATPPGALDYVLHDIDQILLMGVDPGFGGQAFIPAVERKVTECRRMIDDIAGAPPRLSVDGGVKVENAARLLLAGAHELVVGSSLFARGEIAESSRIMAEAMGVFA